MRDFLPILIVGAIIGVLTIVFVLAYALMKNKKEAFGFDRNMKDGEIVRRLLRYAKPYAGSFLFVLLLMTVSVAYDIISPLMIGNIVDMLKGEFRMSEIFVYVALYASVLVVSLTSTYFQSIILQKTGQKIISGLREELFFHIENLSHAQHNAIPVGKLVTRVTNDTGAISQMFTNIIVNLVKNVFVVLGVLIAMLCLNYTLTLMVLAFVPFIVVFTVIFRKFSRRAYRRVKDGTTDINTFLSENLSGMKITQIFGKENEKTAQFRKKNNALGKAKEREILVFGVFRPVVYMLYVASVMCLFYIAGRGYIDNVALLGQTISAATVVSFYMYINKFYNPIQSLADQFNWLQSAFASAEKIFTIFDMKPEITDAPDAIELEKIRGEVEFSHVWFAYEGEDYVLRDVSFRVHAGQTLALVGATGSGKSTILSLLCRNYDVLRGSITLDGVDIRKIKLSCLRSALGQMLQDVFLFSGTVRSNIVLRDDSITDEEVMRACRYVNADKFIDKLPGGLDEPVRERGNNFSQGQRQLLSFARTIVHKPSVMILDEATANIDTETEVLIQDSLERMMNIGTMIIVAHRLSTIRSADKILVLSAGEIIEEGTHSELIDLRGKYYGMYMLQYHREAIRDSAVSSTEK